MRLKHIDKSDVVGMVEIDLSILFRFEGNQETVGKPIRQTSGLLSVPYSKSATAEILAGACERRPLPFGPPPGNCFP